MESEHGWTFLFLGAGIDAMSESGSLGMSTNNSFSYSNTDDGTRNAYVNLSAVISKGRGLDINSWNMSKDSLMSDRK